MEGAAIKIRTKAKAATSKMEKINHMDKGMKNPMPSAIIAKNMGIMPMSVEKNNMI